MASKLKAREFCDDWDCPAAASCGHAFWRSKACAEMRMPCPPARKFGRDEGAEACTEYFTDKPRDWIREVGAPNFIVPSAFTTREGHACSSCGFIGVDHRGLCSVCRGG